MFKKISAPKFGTKSLTGTKSGAATPRF